MQLGGISARSLSIKSYIHKKIVLSVKRAVRWDKEDVTVCDL